MINLKVETNIVVEVNHNDAYVQKLTGNQLRARKYRVKLTEIITIPSGLIHPPLDTTKIPHPVTPCKSVHQNTHYNLRPKTLCKISYTEESSDDSNDELTYSDFLPSSLCQVNHNENRPKRTTRLPSHLEDYILNDSLNLFIEDPPNDHDEEEGPLTDDTVDDDKEPSSGESNTSDDDDHRDTGRPLRDRHPPDRYTN